MNMQYRIKTVSFHIADIDITALFIKLAKRFNYSYYFYRRGLFRDLLQEINVIALEIYKNKTLRWSLEKIIELGGKEGQKHVLKILSNHFQRKIYRALKNYGIAYYHRGQKWKVDREVPFSSVEDDTKKRIQKLIQHNKVA